jgi:hypothetical protein
MIETASLFGHLADFTVTIVPFWVVAPKNTATQISRRSSTMVVGAMLGLLVFLHKYQSCTVILVGDDKYR